MIAHDGRIERNLNTIESLPDITRRQGVGLHTDVLRAQIAVATGQDCRLLDLAEGSKVYRVTRLRSAGGTPLSLEYSRLPALLFPGLIGHDVSTLYRCLREHYRVMPEYSDETLELTFADEQQAHLLGIEPGSALVHIHRVTMGDGGAPIEIGRELFVGERMRFHLRKHGFVRHSLSEAAGSPEAR